MYYTSYSFDTCSITTQVMGLPVYDQRMMLWDGWVEREMNWLFGLEISPSCQIHPKLNVTKKTALLAFRLVDCYYFRCKAKIALSVSLPVCMYDSSLNVYRSSEDLLDLQCISLPQYSNCLYSQYSKYSW